MGAFGLLLGERSIIKEIKMKWLLIDNLMPNEPLLVNLTNVTDFKWKAGTLSIDYIDGTKDDYECEQAKFIEIASMLDIVKEIE